MAMDELAKEIHETAREKGFWDHDRLRIEDPVTGDVDARPQNPSIDAEKIALMHSELSEALEALRDGDTRHLEEELADTIIRILDYCAARELSMDKAIRAKMEVNRGRERLHGREW